MRNIIEWCVQSANQFVYISFALNVFYAVVFWLAGNDGKAVYFAGAAILTVGLIMMR